MTTLDDWPTGVQNIPMFAMLDVWMALRGAHSSQDFEAFAAKHGYAETWARLMAEIREAVTMPYIVTVPDEAVDRVRYVGSRPGGVLVLPDTLSFPEV